MEENDSSPLNLERYQVHLTSVCKGKGLATYYKDTKFSPELDFTEKDCQLSKFTSINIDVVSIYRSTDCKIRFEDMFKSIKLSKDKPTLIVGDMNICYQEQRKNENIQYLIANKFKQFVACKVARKLIHDTSCIALCH